jgi:hypothetical protein
MAEAPPGTAQHMKSEKGKGHGDKKQVPMPIHGHGHGSQVGHNHRPNTPRRHSH